MSGYRNKIIELFTQTNPSTATRKEFHDWLVNNRQESQKEEALYHLWNEPNTISKEETLQSLATLKSKTKRTAKKSALAYWRYAAAIALIVCATTAYLLTNNVPLELNFVEHYSPVGKINTITLPDGSVVETNSSSVLVFPENFGKETRTLYLTGEANFKVVKNAQIPFIVKSKNFAITALGTEFNVSSYPDDNEYKATLISGSVKVEDTGTHAEYLLHVSEQFAYNKLSQTHLIANIDLDDVTAWQRGELVFRGATVQEIIKVLERKYGAIFHYKAKTQDNDKYNFRFQKDASLEKLLDVIKNVATGFNYKKVDDVYYITN